jgi:hypothetical protein
MDPNPTQALESELAVTESEIRRHMNSMEWAFAMGHGCSMDGAHPKLTAIRDRVTRLITRSNDIKAQIAEFA